MRKQPYLTDPLDPKGSPDQVQPPRWADRLLAWFVAPHLLEYVQGDLHEAFHMRVAQVGPVRARREYVRAVFHCLTPFFYKRKPNQPSPLLNLDMILNYLKIAQRNLWKNKVYSAINIVGLAIGLACSLTIGLYIFDEYSYDRFHTQGKHIYRVVERQNQAGTHYDVAVTPAPLAATLKADFAQIKQTCRVGRSSGILQKGQVTTEVTDIRMVDNSFFTIFNFPFLVGNPSQALLNTHEVVITERLAERFFGAAWQQSNNLIGQSFQFNQERTLILVGIIQNPPSNSHLQFDMLLSMRYEDEYNQWADWNSNNYHTYLQLAAQVNVSSLEKELEQYLTKFTPTSQTTLFLQSLFDIYLYSDFDFQTDWSRTGSIAYLRIFLAVGVIVLLIALFNFINLATARAVQRAREVGVRKAIGALRRQLVIQFLTESLLMTFLSTGLALVLLLLFLPLLNTIAAKSLSIPLREPIFGMAIIGFALFIGLLAGIYPAFYLSRFDPVKVLKGVFDVASGQLFRRSLVVGQFTCSVILISSAIVIYDQLTLLQDKHLGFDKSQIVYVRMKNELSKKALLMKNDLQTYSSIAGVSAASSNLIDVISSTGAIYWEGQPAEDKFLVTQMNIDPHFLSTTGMRLLAGRNFDARISTDTASAYIINQTAARRMGWTPQGAIGKMLTLWDRKGRVIGVVQDFHFRPLTATIEPFLFKYWPKEPYAYLLVKTTPQQTRQAIDLLEQVYKKYEQQTAPHYEFMDQGLEKQYRTQQRTGQVVMYFSALAIFVSCLGLLGLVTFTAERRTKEIGIRKVLGASAGNIVRLLTKDFLKLVLIAFVIALPIAWYTMSRWLESFAYRIDLTWWMFALAGLLTISIAVLTISFQSIKAAWMNPVKSLRNE